ncbi:FxsA family protein [Neisseriaceae bacterium B1]
MQYLGFAFLVMLFLEVLSIVVMANMIGGLATFGLIVLSFVLGLFILRRTAGFSKVLMAGELLRGQGAMSFYQMMWPIRIPVAGFLLMLPGFLSTIGALVLLLPIKGKPIVQAQTQVFGDNPFATPHQARDDGDIIDGDYVVRDGDKAHPTSARKHLEVIEHQKD